MLQKYFCSSLVSTRALFLITGLCVGLLLVSYFFDQSLAVRGDANHALRFLEDDPDANKPHRLFGSYYNTRDGLTATLLLNNKGPQPLEVRPTIYNMSGQSIEISAVIVEASSFRHVNLQEWAALGDESFAQGKLKLFHVGKDLVLGAQIYLTDEANSLSFEEKLAEIDKLDSRRLEGVWWMPSRRAEVQIVLSNTTDTPLPITAELSKSAHQTGTVHFFELAAQQTRVLNLRPDFIEGEQFAKSEIIGLSLEHGGEKSALLARAMISDRSTGYSNIVQLSNPAGGKSSEYQGVGFQIDEVKGEPLVPIIVARNVGTMRLPCARAYHTRGLTIRLES